ncbi:MAG: transcription termination factor NusA [Alphaproteobacteria bacterium]
MAGHKIKKNEGTITIQPKGEILTVAEAVAQEKDLSREEVLCAMEEAIQKSVELSYGQANNVYSRIDRDSGAIKIIRSLKIVKDVLGHSLEISLEDAHRDNASLKIGDDFEELLPPIEFSRIIAQNARQIILKRVKEVERIHQYNDFKDRAWEVVSGIVKRIEFGNAIIEFGKSVEGILRREDMIPRENIRIGERLRALIVNVDPNSNGPVVTLSRTHPTFMEKLFEQEVPEIYDGVIEIKAVARDPGSRAKFAVYTKDPTLDPVGACVGIRGSRVQVIVNELQGEKIDIITWSSDVATFIVNALSPAEITKIIIDEDSSRVEVVAAEDQLTLAVGRRGQNVKLASQLTNWHIDIITEKDESERRSSENKERSALFMEALSVDDMIAHLLSVEGFTSIEEIADVDLEEFAKIEGFEKELAQELQTRARNYIEKNTKSVIEKCRNNGMEDQLLNFDGLSTFILKKLDENQIYTLENFAELSSGELIDIIGDTSISQKDADTLIMKARAHWFDEDLRADV